MNIWFEIKQAEIRSIIFRNFISVAESLRDSPALSEACEGRGFDSSEKKVSCCVCVYVCMYVWVPFLTPLRCQMLVRARGWTSAKRR